MRRALYFLLGVIALYLVLMIPIGEKDVEIQKASQIPFIWGQDKLWESLEESFQEAREMEKEELDSLVLQLTTEADKLLDSFEDTVRYPSDSYFSVIENTFFMIAPLIAAQEVPNDWYIEFYNRVRKKVKEDSRNWDMSDPKARATSYRVLYGLRAATEEILLQVPDDSFKTTFYVNQEISEVPSVDVLGIEVHSGDLLVSRGGAEVSAFISRGNDYPGNFSHVAMIYVTEEKVPHFVEAHIEKGVAIASLDEYLKDKKLRFMVMRPWSDLNAIIENPGLPHQAAKFIYDRSQEIHIPYDFKMDYYDSSAMFCSEVGSFAYKNFGLNLWEFESTISSDGIVSWLNTFGVENFVTQMPSDLEYDPQLTVVAEWRDRETLFKDHLDNAVMDALIEKANRGEELSYNSFLLPLARVVKGWSLIQNMMGMPGVIPEGMSATRALKNNEFVDRFSEVRKKTEQKVDAFIEEYGYKPPYWQMVSMAEEALTKEK